MMNNIDYNALVVGESVWTCLGTCLAPSLFLPSLEYKHCTRLPCSLCVLTQQYLDGWLAVDICPTC